MGRRRVNRGEARSLGSHGSRHLRGGTVLELPWYGRPNRTKALGEGAWGDTRMVGWGNTMMSDGLVARMVWIGCEDGCDRLRDCVEC
jgi:hypothetical protein